MQPINYMTGVADPLDRAFQGYATGLNFQAGQQEIAMNAAREARAQELHPLAVQGAGLGLDAQQQAMEAQRQAMDQSAASFGQQQQEAQTAQQRRDAFNARMGDLAALGNNATQEDYLATMTEFPEFAKGLSDTWQTISADQQRGTAQVLGQAAAALQAGNTDLAKDLGTRFRDAALNSGNQSQAAAADAMLKLMDASPEAAAVSLRTMLTQNAPDVADKVYGGGTQNSVQSTQMIGGRISVQTMRDGSVRVVDSATGERLEGQAAQDAIRQAEEAVAAGAGDVNRARRKGELEADVALGGTAAAAQKAGTIAQEQGLEAFTRVGKIKSGISTIDQAIAAIDNGARSGQIESRAPTWNAQTIELRRLGNELGLDVIGSVTFGALSEGELNLAMQTALPTNMNEADLRAWLESKKAAQQKLLGYMEEQARFLSRPGNTISGWLDKVDARAGQPSTPAPDEKRKTPSYLR